jgi:predicted Rdx family selenoprotein
MRDISRLDKFYDELKEIHKKNFPDWRFGQMIVNVLADWQAKTKRDIFFPEEDEMIQIFRDYVSKEREDG